MIIDLYRRLKENELRLVAAALAFSTLLSMIPFLALTFAFFQTFADFENFVPKVQGLFFRYFREAFGNEVVAYLKLILGQIKPQTLGTAAALFLIFTSTRLLQDMEYGINRMWHKTPSPLYRRMLIAWGFLILIPIALALYAGVRSVDLLKPLTHNYRDLLDSSLLIIGLFTIYKWIPVAKVKTSKALIGALVAGMGLIVLKNSFSYLMKTFFVINKIYGSMAAIPLFLIHILIFWYIVLIGAAFVASLHKASR
jgi:membrane protein